MSEDELRRIYNMFTAAWKFFRKYSDIQQTENARWEQLVEESGQIAKAYGNCKLIRGLLLAAVDELEQRSKEGRRWEGEKLAHAHKVTSIKGENFKEER